MDKNLRATKKILNITVDIDKQDKKLEKKIKEYNQDIEFYNNLLKYSNKYYFTIMENLKDVV